MNAKRPIERFRAACLILTSGVLLLGIIQWSFLPVLIQAWPASGTPLLVISAGHTSKFAAPYKFLFGDGLKPCLAESKVGVRQIESGIVRLPEAPTTGPKEVALSDRPLRAPPAA